MVAPSDESVQYSLLLNAQQALKELQAFNKAAISSGGAVDSLQKRIINFEQVVAAEARKAGVAFEQQLAAFEKLDAKLKSSKKAGVVGASGGVDPFQATQAQHDEISSVNDAYMQGLKRRQEASESLQAENRKLLSQADEVGRKSLEAGEKGEKGANRAKFATQAWNIAIGMLIHQGINLLINAFQAMFTMALNGLRELETATYNLVNAERTLSEQGVDITPKGLDETIRKLQELDPLLSRTQATEVVSRVSSLVAPNVGFNAEEVRQFSEAVAILAVKNRGLGKSFEEVESQMSNAFLSGKVSVGINQLGVKITDQIVKDEALRIGLVKSADEFDSLTGKIEANVRARAMLSVVVQSTNKEIAHLPEFFKTADAKFGIFQARMSDFFARIGEIAAPILIAVFDTLAKGFEKAIAWIDKNRDALNTMASAAAALTPILLKLLGFVLKVLAGTAQLFVGMAQGLQLLINKIPFIKKLVDLIAKIVPQTNTSIGDAEDTPTGTPDASLFGGKSATSPYGSGYADAVKEAEEKVTEIMKDAHEKQQDLARDHANKLADLARDAGRKLADIARATRDKIEDANKDYGDKVTDINSDYDKKVAEAKQESYKKAIDAEKKYQDELKNLREKYLMDLEEALRNRDARAILKLMQQYKLDKNKALENRDEERQSAKKESAQKVKDLEQERKDKLQAAQKDLADKIKQIQVAAARERRDAQIAASRALADARQAYQRQLAEQRLFLQRKLADLAASIASEYKLTAAGQAAIRKIIASSAAGSQGASSSQYTSSTPTVSSTWAQAGLYGTGGMAEGGTFLATRPATINVAENRPEMITATPLGKPGKDISKVFTNGSAGGASGQIELGLTLSPDLEARIISQTLSETANVVLKINRSK